MKWNRIFRLDEAFPYPNINIELGNTYHSEFIDSFPEIKMMIKKWANANLDELNCENIGKYIRNEAVPAIYQTYLSENSDSVDEALSLVDFLRLFKLKNISDSTVWRWMRDLGFSYDERRKTCFSDKDENKENVQYRQKFIKKYFEYEKRTYRWVQVPEEWAVAMENDEEETLAKNTFYEYESENKKMREYHIDTHPLLQIFEPKMSVRCESTAK